MCMSFVHTIITSSVYSTNTIMKIVFQEAILKIVGDSESGVRTVYERGVKGGMK